MNILPLRTPDQNNVDDNKGFAELHGFARTKGLHRFLPGILR